MPSRSRPDALDDFSQLSREPGVEGVILRYPDHWMQPKLRVDPIAEHVIVLLLSGAFLVAIEREAQSALTEDECDV